MIISLLSVKNIDFSTILLNFKAINVTTLTKSVDGSCNVNDNAITAHHYNFSRFVSLLACNQPGRGKDKVLLAHHSSLHSTEIFIMMPMVMMIHNNKMHFSLKTH